MLKIQRGSASQISRTGTGKHYWFDIATGETEKELIKNLLTGMNNDEFDVEHSFFRLVTHKGKIKSF